MTSARERAASDELSQRKESSWRRRRAPSKSWLSFFLVLGEERLDSRPSTFPPASGPGSRGAASGWHSRWPPRSPRRRWTGRSPAPGPSPRRGPAAAPAPPGRRAPKRAARLPPPDRATPTRTSRSGAGVTQAVSGPALRDADGDGRGAARQDEGAQQHEGGSWPGESSHHRSIVHHLLLPIDRVRRSVVLTPPAHARQSYKKQWACTTSHTSIIRSVWVSLLGAISYKPPPQRNCQAIPTVLKAPPVRVNTPVPP